MFSLTSPFIPRGDQPTAINALERGLKSGVRHQTLLGVTGSGKTYTIASVIERTGLPTLVISPNKTLSAQLYQEFKSFFPNDEVHYFVSYYDYYQPEAYIPHSNTYIQKDARINKNIDRLRHAALQSVVTKRNVIVVASVSCIYGLGDPNDYRNVRIELSRGQHITPGVLARHLTTLHYARTTKHDPKPGEFHKGNHNIVVHLVTGELLHIEFFQNTITQILSAEGVQNSFAIYPANFWITPEHKRELALENIRAELDERIEELQSANKFTEAERLEHRTLFDIEEIRKRGYVNGIENYSRHFSFRKPGEPPATLLDYFPRPFLTIIDESHIAVPQIRGMHAGDRQRKTALATHGWRLPSALDNRPLTFDEFTDRTNQVIFVSATPGTHEASVMEHPSHVIEQIVRPTGILDPTLIIKPAKEQIDNLLTQIKKYKKRDERVLALTLTKRQAEDLTEFLLENDIKAGYIHSEIKTLDRPKILNSLRRGEYDVLVGINLLREGLDLPEVGLVAILDADREGFLRNYRSIIQIAGRAARSATGTVILYADTLTDSIKRAISETHRRKQIQAAYNTAHNIEPSSIRKSIAHDLLTIAGISSQKDVSSGTDPEALEQELQEAIKNWEFEKAEAIKERIKKRELRITN